MRDIDKVVVVFLVIFSILLLCMRIPFFIATLFKKEYSINDPDFMLLVVIGLVLFVLVFLIVMFYYIPK